MQNGILEILAVFYWKTQAYLTYDCYYLYQIQHNPTDASYFTIKSLTLQSN